MDVRLGHADSLLAPSFRERTIRPMTDQPTRSLDLHLEIADDEELAELERALLRARAAELGDVRRRTVRLTAGYGDDTTREVLDDEGRRAQLRYGLLSKLLDALERVR
jgi:hypothetical protein